MEQPHESAPIWDPCVTGAGLMFCSTVPYPHSQIPKKMCVCVDLPVCELQETAVDVIKI